MHSIIYSMLNTCFIIVTHYDTILHNIAQYGIIAVEYINSNMFSWQVELPQPLGLCTLYMYKY